MPSPNPIPDNPGHQSPSKRSRRDQDTSAPASASIQDAPSNSSSHHLVLPETPNIPSSEISDQLEASCTSHISTGSRPSRHRVQLDHIYRYRPSFENTHHYRDNFDIPSDLDATWTIGLESSHRDGEIFRWSERASEESDRGGIGGGSGGKEGQTGKWCSSSECVQVAKSRRAPSEVETNDPCPEVADIFLKPGPSTAPTRISVPTVSTVSELRSALESKPKAKSLLQLELDTLGEDWLLALQEELTKPYFLQVSYDLAKPELILFSVEGVCQCRAEEQKDFPAW